MNGQPVAGGAAHPIVIFQPQTGTTCTSQAFHLKEAEHVSIGIILGAEGGSPPALPTSIVVNQCTSAAGANATPLPGFHYYYQLTAGAGNDVLNGNAGALTNTVGPGPNWATTTAGITSFPASVAGLQYWIEIDSAELEAIADAVGPQTEYPYLQVVVTNGNSSSYITMVAILTGLRHAELGGYTMTT